MLRVSQQAHGRERVRVFNPLLLAAAPAAAAVATCLPFHSPLLLSHDPLEEKLAHFSLCIFCPWKPTLDFPLLHLT